MNDSLHHRGPDASGIWLSPCKNIYFGHKRLAIIDLDSSSKQPIVSYDRRFILSYNGEIYNYKVLKKQCINLGSRFNTASDSEVIIECYRHWGVDCLSKFKGMWSFLLYDVTTKKILISRDPFGIKPLYYGFYNGAYYFASEPKALICINNYFNEPDHVTAKMFLEFGYLDRDEWTFYKNIKRFPHANYSVIDYEDNIGKLSFNKYWQPSQIIRTNITFDKAAKKLKDLLVDSVRLHLTSDVPVGACLSGGIDSSAIVSIAAAEKNNLLTSSFTSKFDAYKSIDETKWAEKIIQTVDIQSYFTEPTQNMLKEHLDNLIWAQDEPFGSLSIFTQYCIYKKISESSVKVILTGQGADEMLAGYLGYVSIYFDELLHKNKYISLSKELFKFKDLNIEYNIKSKVKSLLKNGIKKIDSVVCNNDVEQHDELHYRLNKLNKSFNGFESRLEDLLCDSNIPQLLRYDDRNSMRFSVESRVPFLETDLVEFVLSLPAEYRIKNGYTKAVLREALKDIIPDAIRTRRDKLGFPAPEVQWLKECYDINVSSNGSKQWREFIYQQWQRVNNNSSKHTLTKSEQNEKDKVLL